MSFDPFFTSQHVPKIDRKPYQPARQDMTESQRVGVTFWVETLPDKIGGWSASFDATFGTGEWTGRRPGKRKDRRDYLCTMRRRGFDADDALRCFRMFMSRCANHVTWFASAEPNPDFTRQNPGFHVHAMLAGCEDVHRVTLQRLWVEENGYAKVLPLRCKSASIRYCTKHVVRRGALYAWQIASSTLWHSIAESSSDSFPPTSSAHACRLAV